MLNRPAFPYFIFLITALLAHGLLLLNDGNYGDGWVLNYYIQTGNWVGLQGWYDSLGGPWVYWIYKAIGQAPKFIFNGIIFANILLVSTILFFFLNKYTPLKRNHSFFIALVVLVWPFNHVIVNIVYVVPLLFVSTFFVGWFLYFYNSEKKSSVLAFISCLLIFISYSYNSLLVYHYIFVVLFYFHINNLWGKDIFKDLPRHVKYIIKDHWVLLILPFIFFALKVSLFKPFGAVENYNSIRFSFRSIEAFVKYAIHILADPFEALFVVGPKIWYILIPAIVLTGFILSKTKNIEVQPDREESSSRLLYLGLLVIFIFAVPFSAVGKYPDIFTERARHGFISGIGFGIFIIGLVYCLFKNKKPLISKWENLILCQLITCLIVINIGFYASWQGRWAKYMAISGNLSQMAPLKNVSIYFLRDDLPSILKPNYEYNDFTLIVNKAWEGKRYLGITPFFKRNRPDRVAAEEAIRIWHSGLWQGNVASENFNSGGCFGEVEIIPKFNKNEMEIGFLYTYYKLFFQEKLESFVLNLVKVDLRLLKGIPCK